MTKKIIFRTVIILITLGIAAFLFFNENGILKYLKLKNELSNLDQEIKNAENKLKALDAEIDSLLNSKVKIEKVARERYHMLSPNENILRVEEK